jgi:REP element-mobilizing transposase RayT
LRQTQGQSVWQRDYYERVIRNERELKAIREYIEANLVCWTIDRGTPP